MKWYSYYEVSTHQLGHGHHYTPPTYHFTTINLAIEWSETHSIFVDHGQNLLTKFVVYVSPDTVTSIGAGIVGAICSIFADSTMVCLTPLGYFTTTYKL